MAEHDVWVGLVIRRGETFRELTGCKRVKLRISGERPEEVVTLVAADLDSFDTIGLHTAIFSEKGLLLRMTPTVVTPVCRYCEGVTLTLTIYHDGCDHMARLLDAIELGAWQVWAQGRAPGNQSDLERRETIDREVERACRPGGQAPQATCWHPCQASGVAPR